MANRPDVVEASWLPGMAPAVITGYLFTAPTWLHGEQPLIVPGSNAGTRIRGVAKHLIDIDFQFGGGYVRRMLLFSFQSEVLPLLRESHPEPVAPRDLQRRGGGGAAARLFVRRTRVRMTACLVCPSRS